MILFDEGLPWPQTTAIGFLSSRPSRLVLSERHLGHGGLGVSARALYPSFVELARELGPDNISMIIPSKWFSGGKNLRAFRTMMLNDAHIRELHDFLHPEDLFPGTNNRGGVCYYLWDKAYDNRDELVRVAIHKDADNVSTIDRPLKLGADDLFVRLRSGEALSILNKVLAKHGEGEMLCDHLSAAKAFGFRTFFVDDERFGDSPLGLAHPVACYGKRGKVGFVELDEVASHREWVGRWKVFVPESNNIGTELSDDNQNCFVGAPDTCCTETYLVCGAELDLDEQSAGNLSVYLQTKFARFLLSLVKVSQHGTQKFYRFVPCRDFDRRWTDAELYEYYGLPDDEVAYIEDEIKAMGV